MSNLSKIVRVLLAVIALTLIANGVMWAFAPSGNMDANSISVASTLGLNMIKSDVGAPLIGAGVFIFLYALRQGLWFYPSVIIAALYTFVRGVSVIVDGYAQMAVIGVALELLVVALLLMDRRISARHLAQGAG